MALIDQFDHSPMLSKWKKLGVRMAVERGPCDALTAAAWDCFGDLTVTGLRSICKLYSKNADLNQKMFALLFYMVQMMLDCPNLRGGEPRLRPTWS